MKVGEEKEAAIQLIPTEYNETQPAYLLNLYKIYFFSIHVYVHTYIYIYFFIQGVPIKKQ